MRNSMYDEYLQTYLYVCRLLKRKFFKMTTTSASFPIIFVKVYKDWILNENGFTLRTVPRWKIPESDTSPDSVILLNPSRFFSHRKDKPSKRPDCRRVETVGREVILRHPTSSVGLRIRAEPVECVPVNEVWCSHLCTTNINTVFSLSTDRTQVPDNRFLIVDPAPSESTVATAEECQVQVFKTSAVKDVDEDTLAGLIAKYLTQERTYFVNGQVSRIQTRHLKCKEVLTLQNNCEIYIQINFSESQRPERGRHQYQIDPRVTRVTETFCTNTRLPRKCCSVPPFSSDLFEQVKRLAEKNMATDVRKRNRLRMLLTGETGSGIENFISYLADNLGLQLVQTAAQELVGDTQAVTELNVGRAVGHVNSCMPSIWNIQDVETLVRDHEGNLDLRLLTALQSNIDQVAHKALVIATTSSKEKIDARLYRLFLDLYELPATLKTEERRSCITRRTQEERLTLTSAKLVDWLTEKTPGFSYGDICTVFNSASISAALRGCDHIDQCDLEDSLTKLKRSRSKMLGLAEVPDVQWEDIGGLEDVKTEIIEAVANISKAGSKRCGILLHGPPGVGKTLLAKAAATQCAMSFISVKGPELLNMYVGQSEENVRTIFKRAKEAEPCIVFFDELDSVAPARGQTGDSGGVMDRVVSALLAELDCLDQMSIIVIGATNRPDLLDPALLRPGRFDKSIYIGTATSRSQQLSILTSLTRKLNLSPDCDLSSVISQFPSDVSGAEVSSIVSNAALRAVERCILDIETKLNNGGGADKGDGALQNDRLEHELDESSQVQMVTFEDFQFAVSDFKR